MRTTWSDVIARRVVRNHLGTPGSSAADVVSAMCGAHAQVLSAGEVSVAMRLDGGTRGGVQQALGVDRSLVKTFGPRGTVHLLPVRDLGLWTGALAALPVRSPFAPGVQLTPAQTGLVVAAIDDAHRSAAEGLTVDELSAEVVARSGAWAGDLVMPAFQTLWPRWRQILGSAHTQGVVCFGPQRGRNVTYTSPERWSPGFTPVEPAVAIRELLRRWLWSYGPAAPAQVAKWLSAPVPWVAEVFASMALEEVSVEGETAWLLPRDASFPAPQAGVRLLPYFGAYAVASHPRREVFPGGAFERALNRGQAGNHPVLLVDGRVAGVWHQRRSGRRVHVTVEAVRPLTPAQLSRLDAEVEALGRIVDAVPALTVGRVAVGPHA